MKAWPRYKGFILSRGGYIGTTDDRADRWYITVADADAWDRRGSGYRSQREAREAIRRKSV